MRKWKGQEVNPDLEVLLGDAHGGQNLRIDDLILNVDDVHLLSEG